MTYSIHNPLPIYQRLFYITAFIVLACIGAIFIHTTPVDAHATLLDQSPAERVVADDPPSTLQLRFNEPIEQELATVTIYDWNVKPVFTGNPDNHGPKRSSHLTFKLPKELNDGTYTVKWQVVSLDGHPVGGSYHFSIGHSTEGGIKTVTDSGDQVGPLIVARTIAEGLLLIASGLFWFCWLAERRGFPNPLLKWKHGRSIITIILGLATIGELITYASTLPPGLMTTIINGRWDLLIDFPFILMLGTQLLCLLLLIIPDMVGGWYLVMWGLLAIIPAFGGHVWGMANPYAALAIRIIHQLAIALWLGALCYMLLLTIQKKEKEKIPWMAIRPFFVKRMIAATSLIVISGVTMVFLQSSWTAVVSDWMNWSTLLSGKILFTMLMLGLAFYQTQKWKKSQTFKTKKLLRMEWIIGLLVIMLGVWMSQSAYPIAVKSYDQNLTTKQATANITIKKLKIGEQTMVTQIPKVDGQKPKKVSVKMSMPDHGMQAGPFIFNQNKQTGQYQTTLSFSMPGTWRLDMVASYPNNEKREWTDDLFIAGNKNN